jgi:regulatory protein
LGLLARREHSKRELVIKLRARNCPDKIITTVVEQLTEEGMQSETRFAESFVRSRIDRGVGPLRIRAELMERGVDDEVVAGFGR